MIETERLILRPWEESDAEAMFKYASDPDIGPIAGWPPHTSVENSLEIIRTVFAAPETYAVVLKATGEPVGSCGIMFSDDLHSTEISQGEAEIGYWIGKPYWGQGLIPEAVKALLERCFKDLHLDVAWCGFYDGNTKSKRVIEKCGFKFHHTNKDIVSPLGDERTEHFYIMTKEDYQAMHITKGKQIESDKRLIAACGLYCGACRKYMAEKCPGCHLNEKASWCKIRNCVHQHGFHSCAECSKDVTECKTYSNLIGKIFAFLFRSDRPACIRYIREHGEEAFADEMARRRCQTMKKQ